MTAAVTFSAMMPMSATAAAFPVMLVIAAMAAFSVVLMAVMAAKGVRVIIEVSGKKCFHCGVCISTHARIQFDACFGKSCSCAASDPAADECVRAVCFQEACKCPVAASVRGEHACLSHLAVFDVVQFECLRVSEMLKNLSAFIGHSDRHLSFLPIIFS